MLWIACALVVLAGAAIGATSIGGVLVVPALSGLAGVPVAEAVAASSLAFLFTGLAGWRGMRGVALPMSALLSLHGAALLGAAAGATMVHVAPPGAVHAWVAGLAAFSGVQGLMSSRRERTECAFPGWAMFAVLGVAVGFGSALSGTGGPVLLLPLLMLMRLPVLPSVALAQSIQLPVALAASSAHAVAGSLPLVLGLQVGLGLLVGAWAGRRLARRTSPLALRTGTSLGLIAVGVWYAIP